MLEALRFKTPRPVSRKLQPNGLTLIETMVALAVMGFILVLALPMMSSGQGHSELRTAATDISAALRAVRSRAVAKNHEEIFLVDTDRARTRYVSRLYGCDPARPDLYHLILDSTAIPLDGCVDVIAVAAEVFWSR